MKYIFEVAEKGPVHLRTMDDEGRVIREISCALRMSEACRWLGRSRRHLYRYVARGWLQPVAKFSGEFFFDKKDLEAYRRGNRDRRASLPVSMAFLFPEYDLRSLQPDRDADLVLSRILERGTSRDIQWALRHYSLARRRLFLKTQGPRLLSARAFHFWTWLWNGERPVNGPAWRNLGRALGGVQ